MPPPSCFLAPNSCHCARMGLNLTHLKRGWRTRSSSLPFIIIYLFIYLNVPQFTQACPPVHAEVSHLLTTPREGWLAGLLFLYDIHAPLNSSFPSAMRTERDYRKQQWWNFRFSLTKGNLIKARGRRECLTSLHFFIDKGVKEIRCFKIRQNLVWSISFHGSGFSFWCLNWNGPPPHTHTHAVARTSEITFSSLPASSLLHFSICDILTCFI